MKKSQGMSTIAISVVIGVCVVMISIASYFIIEYLGTDPAIREISKEIKFEYGIDNKVDDVSILKQEGKYIKGDVNTSSGSKKFFAFSSDAGINILSISDDFSCEVGIANGFPEDFLDDCKSKTKSLSVSDAKDKIDDGEKVSVFGVINFPSDPSGQVTLSNGDDSIDIIIKTPDIIDGVGDGDVVVVEVDDGDVDSVKKIDDDSDSNEDNENDDEDDTISEPDYSEPQQPNYNLYDIDEGELIKLLND